MGRNARQCAGRYTAQDARRALGNAAKHLLADAQRRYLTWAAQLASQLVQAEVSKSARACFDDLLCAALVHAGDVGTRVQDTA